MTTNPKQIGERKPGIKLNREVYIFLVCLFIATLWWFLNAFSKDGYEAVINYPLEYDIYQENQVVSNPLQQAVTIRIKGHGFALMSQEFFGGDDTLAITSSMITKRKVGGRTKGYINQGALHQQFAQQLPDDVQIIEIMADSIYFDFDHKVTRDVAVVPRAEVTLASGYSMDQEITLSPSKIKVTGPSRVLDTMMVVHTTPQGFQALQETVVVPVALEAMENDHVKLSAKQVEMTVSVAKMTEKLVNVPIRTAGLPDSVSVKLFPEYAEARLLVPITLYNEYSDANVRLKVAYKDMLAPEAKRLRVTSEVESPYVKVLGVEPEKVEFLILSK